jgi:hypothetical protein
MRKCSRIWNPNYVGMTFLMVPWPVPTCHQLGRMIRQSAETEICIGQTCQRIHTAKLNLKVQCGNSLLAHPFSIGDRMSVLTRGTDQDVRGREVQQTRG